MNGKDIGAFVKAAGVLAPQSVDASADANGTGVDRLANGLPLSCVAVVQTGTASGSPSAQSHVFKVQHADDDGSGSAGTYADLTDATVTVTADATLSSFDVDLSGAKQWIRLMYDESSAFTGGSSPATYVSGCLLLGGFDTLPQS